LDEIEKAHPEAFNMLLQILEDGNLSDAKGRRVDFRNTILIMTSNIAADMIQREGPLGFAVAANEQKKAEQNYQVMKDKVLGQLKQTFRPEFLNRIDGVIVFHPLSAEEIRRIVELELKRVRKQLTEKEITLEVTEAAMDLLGTRGYDRQFGARPLRRIIQNLIEDPLAEGLLENKYTPGSKVVVDVREDLLTLEKAEDLVPVS
jgi:ATP-dependent Clp protease ATP-binding subunit ClpC